MTDTKHTTSKEHTRTSGFTFPFGKYAEMFASMRNCCGSDKRLFTCCASMQQMCGSKEQEAQEQ